MKNIFQSKNDAEGKKDYHKFSKQVICTDNS